MILFQDALREELEQEKMSHGELAQEIELLNGQLEEMREESEEIINEWKGRFDERISPQNADRLIRCTVLTDTGPLFLQ